MFAFPRLSQLLPEINLKSVEESLSKEQFSSLNTISKGFKEFIKQHPMKPWDKERHPYVITPRGRFTQGPNGTVTMASSLEEAGALITTTSLSNAFQSYCQLVDRMDFHDYVKELASKCQNPDTVLGKILLVPDSLNKHRLVAIVDYWTNLLLSPLEEIIRTKLRVDFHHTDFLRNHTEGAAKAISYKGKS